MLSTVVWLRIWIYLGCIFGWTGGARPQFDTSTNMGLVLVPADAEVDSVIFRLRATDQDADFPLIFDITAAVQPIVRVANLPCTLYNKVCQANVILTRRLVPGRLHDFAVRVRDSKGDSNSMQATISVTNATTPRDMIFPHVPSIIMVPEDTKPGKELDYLLVRANPWHGKPVYIELWQPKELFSIRQRQTPTQTRGVIILEGELDFETQSMYTLTMYATDPYTEAGKDTRNIAGVHVVVIVQDVQDVPPVFTIAPPLTRVNNTVKPGDVVLRVHAEDGDKGTPREVTYGLVSEGNPFTPFFNISEGTGEIILARPLEELTQITHVGAPILLSVVAEEVRRSRDEPPGQATVVELGLVLGEPGNSPPYFGSDSYVAWMDENSPPGTVVMFEKPDLTTVKDEDIGKTGVFALKLGNNNGTFEVTPSVVERAANFVVTVRDNVLMDYELRKTVQFMIIAQEVGPATNLSTSVIATIFLRDVNDNPPEFEKNTYEVTLVENVPSGTRVVQIQASDKDTGLSGIVRYTRIIGPGSETLTMDPETGLIVVAKGSTGLDRETTANLELSVEACDENGRGLCSIVPLIVNLLDVNDNAPIFEKSVYEFILNSDQTNFTSPAFIKAIDADAEPPNNEVRYELVHGNYGNKFYLNEVTGELILREPLNKSRKRRNNGYVNFASRFRSDFLQTLETFQKIGVSTDKPLRIWKNRKKRATDNVLFTLTVRAYDSGVPHRSSTAKVQIVTATPMGALTLMLVVPAEHLDPVRTTETLAAITGGRVTIQEIRPYDQPSDGTAQGGRMSVVVARVEPTMSGTFLVDVETIHKSLVASGMGIVPVTNTSNVPTGNTVNGNGNGSSNDGTDKSNTGNPTTGTVGTVNVGAGESAIGKGGGQNIGESSGNLGGSNPGRPTVLGTDDKTNLGNGGNTGEKNPGDSNGGASGGTGKGPIGNGGDDTGEGTRDDGGVDGTTGKGTGNLNGGGTSGGTNLGPGSKDESSGTINGGSNGGISDGQPTGSSGNPGGVGHVVGTVLGSKGQAGVDENFNKINKTTISSENEYIVYKAENKLLLWLLILLGLLMLLGLLALILCCICPGCPFYMAPRKRRVHSFESVNHLEGRPKRHIRRKQLDPLKAEWSGKKQAWSADPMRRNWQFNRRNTKNRGLASLPGDVAFIETPEAHPKGPALRLRDGPEPWNVQYPIQTGHKEDLRMYVEDVEAGRPYDTEDVDSIRRHEMERGSDVLRQSYRQQDEIRLPREQHFYRDGNAEVLRLVTGGHLQGEEIPLDTQRPVTLINDQQALGYRGDGKDILLRRFMEDQKIRQDQDLHGSVQEIFVDGPDPGRQGSEFLRKHEVIVLPGSLEKHRHVERASNVQRLVIDHGDVEEEIKLRNQQLEETQEADLRKQRKIAAAMLVGSAVSKATENPKTNFGKPTSVNVPTYTIHDVELAKQNALLTQLLMDRDARHLAVPGTDPGSYLETQSLPGQVAIATQTDRTAATQTENRSRSDNEESEEEIRSRKKSKSKKRFGSEMRRSRSLWPRSPIQEETRSVSETRTNLLRRKAKETREGRRATLEPDVLREISDSLDEQATTTPSPDEGQDVEKQTRRTKKAEYQSEEREEEIEEMSEARSSPDTSKNKYHRRSHAKTDTAEALQAQKIEASGKQGSSAKSKAGSQKTEAKKGKDPTNGDKKETEASTDPKNHSKKGSNESQSNTSGTETKKEADKRKTSKLLSKVGLLKSSTEKSAGKNKPRESEEVSIAKKRTTLKHQKAKKVSTESSEIEEVPAKSRHPSLKVKAPKPPDSITGVNPKLEPAKGGETSTLSDEPKSKSSGTEPDRVSKGYKKLEDSTSGDSTATGQGTTKVESTIAAKSGTQDTKKIVKGEERNVKTSAPEPSIAKKVAEVMKQPISMLTVDERLKSNDVEVEGQSPDDRQPPSLTPETVLDKGEALISESVSEILKPSSVLKKDESEMLVHDTSKMELESSQKSEKNSLEMDSVLPKVRESDSAERKAVESTDEGRLKVANRPGKSQASGSQGNNLPIEKKLESSATVVAEQIEKMPETLKVDVSKNDEKVSSVSSKEPEPLATNEVTKIKERILEEKEKEEEEKRMEVGILSAESQSVPRASETLLSTSEKLHDKPEGIPPHLESQVTRTDAKTNVEEELSELLNAKKLTEAFLQSETMQSSYDPQVTLVETVPSSSAVKTVIPNPVDVDDEKILEQGDAPKSSNLVTKRIDDEKSGSNEAFVNDVDPSTKSPVKSSDEKHDSFVVIANPEETRDAASPTVRKTDEEKLPDTNEKVDNNSESKDKLVDNGNGEPNEKSDPLETSQRLGNESATPRGYKSDKSVEKIGMEVATVKEEKKVETNDNRSSKEDINGKKSPGKKSSQTSSEDNLPTTGSPSFYILSSGSSAEDFIPDQETSQALSNPRQTLNQKTNAPGFSESVRDDQGLRIPTEKTKDLVNVSPAQWDPRQIQIGNTSGDSPDNSRPYQTPRHRSRNREDRKPEVGESSGEIEAALKVEAEKLTPRLIAEEAIRSGLQEIIDSDAMKGGSSSQTSSKTSPESQKQRRETSKRRTGKNGEKKKPSVEKSENVSHSTPKIEDSRLTRPKTDPKAGNPRDNETRTRPRTQRGKPTESSRQEPPTRRSKLPEKIRPGKPNPEETKETKPQDTPDQQKSDEVAPSKEGYMSRYKQKREEMERKRREQKEAAEEEQRPRWQKKPAVIPVARIPIKETREKDKVTDSKTPEGATPRTKRRKIKPLANAESEQLRAMVKEGRKLRRAEGGDSDDPTVEIFASEPPAKFEPNFQDQQPTSYKFDKIAAPFYLHPPPPPPPNSSPQVSPQHLGPLDTRRLDDDLDSGIAVSLQGGTKLRHQQLLEKKSVFDIAYSEAAPSQLRTDSTTPPS